MHMQFEGYKKFLCKFRFSKFRVRLSAKRGFGGLLTPNSSFDTKGEWTELGPFIMLK